MPTFLAEFTAAETAAISEEFKRLEDNIYLDHAGTTLYSERQISEATRVLQENLFCNPHTCKVTGDLVDQVRYRILQHFNTDATEYTVIFTANATAALKIVGECFQFTNNGKEQKTKGTGGCFYYCEENHTSVLGMRELVQTEQLFVLTKNELVANLKLGEERSIDKATCAAAGNSLVAFSAQCNFSGYKMPLEIIEYIHRQGLLKRGTRIRGGDTDQQQQMDADEEDGCNFYVCLDSASFVATNMLDLQRYKPDFCVISFYKMFGFPTGVGALIVNKRAEQLLKKRYYGGGTVKIAMTREDFHVKRGGLAERFEDGTLAFLSIAALLEGFRTLDRLVPSMPNKLSIQRISQHVFQLAKYCYHSLSALRHANETPLIKFYNHTDYSIAAQQGGIVTFNILHDDGTYVGFAEVACIAAVHNVQLRTGCFCNPGACQHFLQLSNAQVRQQYEAGHICSDYNDLVQGQPTGAVRLSFGYMTRLTDVSAAIDMLRACYLTTPLQRLRLLTTQSKKLPKILQAVSQRWQPRLQQICIYPVKSCAAFATSGSWPLTNSGLKYDRNWMIVDNNGMAMTQKHCTRLCLIKPVVHVESAKLELTFPALPSLILPLDASGVPKADDPLITANVCRSKVCNDLVGGSDCGDKAAAWLDDCLQLQGLRLIRQSTERLRCAADGITRMDIALANKAQFLLLNRTSVQWLTNKLDVSLEPLDHTVDRFRANFIIKTSEPLEENTFAELNINGIAFKVDGPCTRCQMICIDQRTGQKTAEPLRTIAREFGGKIRFGVYLSLRDGLSAHENTVISCKDALKIEKFDR